MLQIQPRTVPRSRRRLPARRGVLKTFPSHPESEPSHLAPRRFRPADVSKTSDLQGDFPQVVPRGNRWRSEEAERMWDAWGGLGVIVVIGTPIALIVAAIKHVQGEGSGNSKSVGLKRQAVGSRS